MLAAEAIKRVARRYEGVLAPNVVLGIDQYCSEGEVGLASEELDANFYELEIEPSLDCVFTVVEAMDHYCLDRHPPFFLPEPPSHTQRPGRFSMANVLEWRQSARGWRRRVKTLLASPGDQVVEVIQWCAPALGAATVASLEADCASCRCARALTRLAEGLYQAHLIPSIAGMRELGALASRLGLTEADWNIWASRRDFNQSDPGMPIHDIDWSSLRTRDGTMLVTHRLNVCDSDDWDKGE